MTVLAVVNGFFGLQILFFSANSCNILTGTNEKKKYPLAMTCKLFSRHKEVNFFIILYLR